MILDPWSGSVSGPGPDTGSDPSSDPGPFVIEETETGYDITEQKKYEGQSIH